MWKDDKQRQLQSLSTPLPLHCLSAPIFVTVSGFRVCLGLGLWATVGCGFCVPDVVVRLIRFGSLPVHKIYVWASRGYIVCMYISLSLSLCLLLTRSLSLSLCVSSRAHIPVTIPLCVGLQGVQVGGDGEGGVVRPACGFSLLGMCVCGSVCVSQRHEIEHIKANGCQQQPSMKVDLLLLYRVLFLPSLPLYNFHGYLMF